ncbi:hypothetical protein GCM10008968_21680 [Bacillus horti]
MQLEEMNRSDALEALEEGEIQAILTIPEHFTSTVLNKLFLNEGTTPPLTLIAENSSAMSIDILQDIIEIFMRAINFQTVLSQSMNEGAASLEQLNAQLPKGGIETIYNVEQVSSFQYFTFAMSVLFVLFAGGVAAERANTEKRERVFERILLTGSKPLRFLGAKLGSTFVIAMLQLVVLFILCHFIFQLFPGRTFQFWIGLGVILAALSLCVGAIGALLTSLNFRMQSPDASRLFNSILVTIMALAGGSFGPMSILPNWITVIGEWTPNGLSLSMLMLWIQSESFSDLIGPLLKLLSISLILLLVGLRIFPQRRQG